jgi:hypothetical protein
LKDDILSYYILFVCSVIVPAKLMRLPRVKANGHGLLLRFQGGRGRFIFQTSGHRSVEAERFIELMRCLEVFSGVCVLTHVLKSNHRKF